MDKYKFANIEEIEAFANSIHQHSHAIYELIDGKMVRVDVYAQALIEKQQEEPRVS